MWWIFNLKAPHISTMMNRTMSRSKIIHYIENMLCIEIWEWSTKKIYLTKTTRTKMENHILKTRTKMERKVRTRNTNGNV